MNNSCRNNGVLSFNQRNGSTNDFRAGRYERSRRMLELVNPESVAILSHTMDETRTDAFGKFGSGFHVLFGGTLFEPS
jgi:hypothetical protein